MLSANALLVAGAGLLISQALSAQLFGGRISVAVIGLTWVITLVFIALSVQSAIGALFGRQSWRRLFGEGPPPGLFYQHTDTLKELSSFEDFAGTFRALDANTELQSATVGLWAGVHAHAFRYASLRRAAKRLNIAFIILLLAFAGILALKVLA
ncbi:hypothetical protein ACIBM8_14585 [Micromonospora aurantiaca]|uniref:hypothetical protein n=1 Tax=Micromonospora aurantiaca (nom. illeg.) TaxID=47850 RepID=UPI003795EFC3